MSNKRRKSSVTTGNYQPNTTVPTGGVKQDQMFMVGGGLTDRVSASSNQTTGRSHLGQTSHRGLYKSYDVVGE